MIFEPTPEEIKATRLAAGLTQVKAAEMVYVVGRAWVYWEATDSASGQRKMPLAVWELFLAKIGKHKIKVIK